MMPAVLETARAPSTEEVSTPPVQGVPGEHGLLSTDEVLATLQRTLGDEVPERRLQAAAVALKEAEAARWEMLPPNINPEMGYNFSTTCRETCWLAREVLLSGATFRVFRLREQLAGPSVPAETLAPAAPALPRPTGETRRIWPGLLAGLGVLVLAALALWGVSFGRSVPAADELVLRDVQAAADLADQHGRAMVAFGARLTEYARTQNGRQPDVQALVVHGDHWRTDGAAMMELAADVRRALATNPPLVSSARSVEFDRLETQARLLSGRGQALAEHGRAMEELAAATTRQVGSSTDPWVRDGLAEMRRQSAQTITVGQRLQAAGQALEESTTRLRRSVRG